MFQPKGLIIILSCADMLFHRLIQFLLAGAQGKQAGQKDSVEAEFLSDNWVKTLCRMDQTAFTGNPTNH